MTRNFRLFQTKDEKRNSRYAVILAGGDGTRLKSLTRAIAGDDRPKQFCHLIDGETLLDRTRDRIVRLIDPANTFYSFTKKHERYYKYSSTAVPERQMVIQPEGRGTAPAILYSLMRIARENPNAAIAFFPSDHYFADDDAFMQHVKSAFRVIDSDPRSVVLLGIQPQNAETSYGWIEPEKSLFGDLLKSVSRVSRFWEKPDGDTAEKLMAAGCLWNSFVMVGGAASFLEMFRKQLPELFRMFSAASKAIGTSNEAAVIRSIYAWIDETNFSSQVLEKSSNELLVMRVGDVGWSDWGEPERVLGTINTLGLQPKWLPAMAA